MDPKILEGRISKCTYHSRCGSESQSSRSLPFFEYQGEGSDSASICKHCGYYEIAHRDEIWDRPRNRVCRNYEPRGDVGFDRHYCGCYGWD